MAEEEEEEAVVVVAVEALLPRPLQGRELVEVAEAEAGVEVEVGEERLPPPPLAPQ